MMYSRLKFKSTGLFNPLHRLKTRIKLIQTDVLWEMHLQISGLKPFRDTLDQLSLTVAAHKIKQLPNGSG